MEPSVSLYMELLENAVDALKAGRDVAGRSHQPANRSRAADAAYCQMISSLMNTRLSFYKRIAMPKRNELEEIKVELIDRFGLLPDPARTLLDIARLRQQAQKLDQEAGRYQKGGVIEFAEKNHVIRLVDWFAQNSRSITALMVRRA